MCDKFHYPSLTITLFFRGVGVVESTLGHRKPKKPDEIGLKGLSKLIVQNSDLVRKCICIKILAILDLLI